MAILNMIELLTSLPITPQYSLVQLCTVLESIDLIVRHASGHVAPHRRGVGHWHVPGKCRTARVGHDGMPTHAEVLV